MLTMFTATSLTAYAQEHQSELFGIATEHLINGEYNQAINIFDEILDTETKNISTLKMRGIANSNLGHNEASLKDFYTVLEKEPFDITSLVGMGVGFGNLGEYQESKKYFGKALEIEPNNVVIQNYKVITDNIISKYPYTSTEKPELLKDEESEIIIPDWLRDRARWWAYDQITDIDFVSGIQYLINEGIIQIEIIPVNEKNYKNIPIWIKNNAAWWAEGQITDEDFASGIKYLIENEIITVNLEETPEIQIEDKAKIRAFDTYLSKISKNIDKEKRYIEYPNPSNDVIKKFLRDYLKWNFEEEVKIASSHFIDPTYQIINGTYVITYNVFVNEQPSGLPLDHVSTLNDSLKFWERQKLEVGDSNAIINFEYTTLKGDANVWVTWVVRDIGEGVLGHAHLGKGVVEVALGDYNCDGMFQLYDVESVEKIMTHELGHSIGLGHVSDETSIMFPSMHPKYAYCLLNI